MKKYSTSVLLCSLVLLAGVVHANVIVNGGFEDSGATTVVIQNPPTVDYTIPGWRVFTTDINSTTFEVVSNATVATEGSHYLKITTVESGVGGLDVGADTDRTVSLNDVTAGVTYIASFDLQHVSGTNSMVITMKTETNGVNADIMVNADLLVPPTGVWTHYSYEITPTVDGDFYIAFRPKAGTTIFDQVVLVDNVSLVVEDLGNAVTHGTFAIGAVGVPDDLFQNATITTHSEVHGVANILDLFSAGNPVTAEDTIYQDLDGKTLAFVEFNTADAVSLTNITIGLQADYSATEADLRAVNKIKIYAGRSPETVMDNLLARILVNPEYQDTYGNTAINVSIDGLSTNRFQYFRVEFTEDHTRLDRGARVFEIDGFGSVLPALPTEEATIIGWSNVSSNVMRMVINAPSQASNYSPQSTANLVLGSWANVPHSDDGVNAFVVTNLDYSTAEGTNEVIYVEANPAVEFYKIIGVDL